MILHLVLMIMMIRKQNTHGTTNAAPNFHKAINPAQTRMFDKERESTHTGSSSHLMLMACCWDTGAGPIGIQTTS